MLRADMETSAISTRRCASKVTVGESSTRPWHTMVLGQVATTPRKCVRLVNVREYMCVQVPVALDPDSESFLSSGGSGSGISRFIVSLSHDTWRRGSPCC